MTLYERLASTDDGEKRLAGARLRYRVLELMHGCLESSGMTKTELAGRLGIRKSAVSQVFGGDGNVRMNTLADYLWGMGYELSLATVAVGTARARVTEAISCLPQDWSEAPRLTVISQSGNFRPEVVRPWDEFERRAG